MYLPEEMYKVGALECYLVLNMIATLPYSSIAMEVGSVIDVAGCNRETALIFMVFAVQRNQPRTEKEEK